MKKQDKIQRISPGEAELLDIFWSHGELTLSQVHEIYSSGTGKPTLQTIQTRLGRMIEKQMLAKRDNHPAVYSCLISKKQTQGKYFELIESLTNRNFAPYILSLVEKRSLSAEEIDALEKVLAKAKSRQ